MDIFERVKSLTVILVLIAATLTGVSTLTSAFADNYNPSETTLVEQNWTAGDNGKYEKQRELIVREIANEQNPKNLVSKYETRAVANLEDRFAVFCWACAEMEYLRRTTSKNDYDTAVGSVHHALNDLGPPYNYELARVVFINEAQYEDVDRQEMADLGNELLKQDSNDSDVLQQVAVTTYRGNLQRAVGLLRRAIRSEPQKSSLYASLGLIYYDSFFRGSHQARYAVSALEYLNKALSLTNSHCVDAIDCLQYYRGDIASVLKTLEIGRPK